VPTIFLTADYNDDKHAIEGYDASAVDYLFKPVNPAILRSQVAMSAELHRRQRAVEEANRALTVFETAKQTFPKEVNINYDADAIQLPNDAVMPLALIANELLTNAVTYGLNGRRSAGNISVRLTKENELFLLDVEEEGPGFDPPSIQRRSSRLALVQGSPNSFVGTRIPSADIYCGPIDRPEL
jgi:anti-sigma regulatory factor (Ser/Thr protein kinase)